MRSCLPLTIICFTCSSFLNDGFTGHSNSAKGIFFDFTVRRLSNERVLISWHTAADSQRTTYEVLRKHTKRDSFASIATVKPQSLKDNIVDYLFTDINNFTDSSYYCLKKTNADSVIFYSITEGIEGADKER